MRVILVEEISLRLRLVFNINNSLPVSSQSLQMSKNLILFIMAVVVRSLIFSDIYHGFFTKSVIIIPKHQSPHDPRMLIQRAKLDSLGIYTNIYRYIGIGVQMCIGSTLDSLIPYSMTTILEYLVI